MKTAPENTTLLIKTIARPEALRRLLASIRDFYPYIPILVADDSEVPYVGVSQPFGAKHISLPHDVGLSFGRNALVDAARTEFVVLLDDDFVFTEKTDLRKLVAPVQGQVFEICGGTVLHNGRLTHYEGRMWKKGDILHLSPLRSDGAPIRVDICYNFFAARREVLRKKVRWHNDLKMCEHQAFFLDAKAAGVRVGYLPTVEINHMPASSKNYGGYRNVRSTQFYERFLELYGLSEIRGSLSA